MLEPPLREITIDENHSLILSVIFLAVGVRDHLLMCAERLRHGDLERSLAIFER